MNTGSDGHLHICVLYPVAEPGAKGFKLSLSLFSCRNSRKRVREFQSNMINLHQEGKKEVFEIILLPSGTQIM